MINLTCNNTLRQHLTHNLNQFTPNIFDPASGRCAAVALTIVDSQTPPNTYNLTQPAPDQASLILTRRSFQLKKHAGQWALPGGRIDTGETAEQTALRELQEEVGLQLDPDRIIGRLDDFRTRSGFIMTPIVVWGGTGAKMVRNPAEVESIHRIPCQEFLRPDAPILESIPDLSLIHI